MAYGTLYTSSFKDINNVNYQFKIEQNNYAGSSSAVVLAQAPQINYLDLKNGYDYLYSSGIEFSLLSTTDRKFISMFTNELQKYRITISGSTGKQWNGFLDVENYEEDFNQLTNYTVNFTANDGIKILERYNYINTTGAAYTGVTSIWQVLNNCLGKIAFKSTSLYTNINTTINGISNTSATTTLHNTYVKNSNFYDEELTPMNCYDVINSILKTFKLYFFQDFANGRFYLIDKLTLSNASNSFKVYDLQTMTYQTTTTISTTTFDISTIKMANGSSNFNIVPAINSQKLNYSQYATDVIVNNEVSISNFTGTTGTTIINTDAEFGWKETTYASNTIWNKPNNTGYTFCYMQGTGTRNSNEKDYYIKMKKGSFDYTSGNTIFTLKNPIDFNCWSSGNYALKVEMNAYFRYKNRLGDDTESSKKIHMCYWNLLLKVGNQQYCYNHWGTPVEYGYNYNFLNCKFFGDAKMSTSPIDSWVSNNDIKVWGGDLLENTYSELITSIVIPMPSTLTGDMILGITNNAGATNYGYDAFYETDMTTYLKDVRLKSLKLSVVDKYGNTIDTKDVLYNAYFDAKNSTKGSEIKMILGTNVKELPIAKGSLMYYDTVNSNYKYIQNFVYNGTTDCIERLTLNNILGTYTNPTYQLSCDVNAISTLLSKITYTNFLTGKVFMISGCKISLEDSIASIKINELI